MRYVVTLVVLFIIGCRGIESNSEDINQQGDRISAAENKINELTELIELQTNLLRELNEQTDQSMNSSLKELREDTLLLLNELREDLEDQDARNNSYISFIDERLEILRLYANRLEDNISEIEELFLEQEELVLLARGPIFTVDAIINGANINTQLRNIIYDDAARIVRQSNIYYENISRISSYEGYKLSVQIPINEELLFNVFIHKRFTGETFTQISLISDDNNELNDSAVCFRNNDPELSENLISFSYSEELSSVNQNFIFGFASLNMNGSCYGFLPLNAEVDIRFVIELQSSEYNKQWQSIYIPSEEF